MSLIVCEPTCLAPRCETRCKAMDMSSCERNCDKPQCALVCPGRECATKACPKCKAACSAPVCRVACPQLQPCRTVCEEPACSWKCRAPQSCPKPVCQLVCVAPKDCPEATTVHKKLPAKDDDEVVMQAFQGPVATAAASGRTVTARVSQAPLAGAAVTAPGTPVAPSPAIILAAPSPVIPPLGLRPPAIKEAFLGPSPAAGPSPALAAPAGDLKRAAVLSATAWRQPSLHEQTQEAFPSQGDPLLDEWQAAEDMHEFRQLPRLPAMH
eukprot:TRINITY_DN37742_c0_g1_i1.p1 TRINITY_DN37742_c0_g1~~TRINITY_DN37742_c0_g1_i1.p1  ORF type:complete len:268 (-),score=32.30 TRINITY_DN37742_c0_g1_i1:101-904(-)